MKNKNKIDELVLIEYMFFIGLSIILIANFFVNILLGAYSLAVILIGFSIFLFKTRKAVSKKE